MKMDHDVLEGFSWTTCGKRPLHEQDFFVRYVISRVFLCKRFVSSGPQEDEGFTWRLVDARKCKFIYITYFCRYMRWCVIQKLGFYSSLNANKNEIHLFSEGFFLYVK